MLLQTIFVVGQDVLKDILGDILGIIVWLLIIGLIVGGALVFLAFSYAPCFFVQFLPMECTCY